MKTLIIGEVNNNELSSGTLEIISKAKELSLDFSVITIGNSETKNIGCDDFTNTYFKSNSNKLNLSSCANEIKSLIEENFNLTCSFMSFPPDHPIKSSLTEF